MQRGHGGGCYWLKLIIPSSTCRYSSYPIKAAYFFFQYYFKSCSNFLICYTYTLSLIDIFRAAVLVLEECNKFPKFHGLFMSAIPHSVRDSPGMTPGVQKDIPLYYSTNCHYAHIW